MIKEISVSSSKKQEIIDISKEISKIVAESSVKNGLCVVYVRIHSSNTINENYDKDVKRDIIYALDKIVPNSGYEHSEGNSDGHVKSSLIGASETIIIEDGNLKLGQWQGIVFCEFDGPRSRKVIVKIIEAR